MNTRLAGHGLIAEGWPYIGTEVRKSHRSGHGMGKCECGTMSPMLPSTAARKRWHRDHKQEIRARTSTPAGPGPALSRG